MFGAAGMPPPTVNLEDPTQEENVLLDLSYCLILSLYSKPSSNPCFPMASQ